MILKSQEIEEAKEAHANREDWSDCANVFSKFPWEKALEFSYSLNWYNIATDKRGYPHNIFPCNHSNVLLIGSLTGEPLCWDILRRLWDNSLQSSPSQSILHNLPSSSTTNCSHSWIPGPNLTKRYNAKTCKTKFWTCLDSFKGKLEQIVK